MQFKCEDWNQIVVKFLDGVIILVVRNGHTYKYVNVNREHELSNELLLHLST